MYKTITGTTCNLALDLQQTHSTCRHKLHAHLHVQSCKVKVHNTSINLHSLSE